MLDIKEKLTQLLIKIFRPLVRILLRHGISYKACAEVLKWCYVDVAHNEFGIKGKKANKSRVAVITGLTWIDVKNLIDEEVVLMDSKPEEFQRASRVLTGWLSDDAYKDGSRTTIIPIYSKDKFNDISFESLVEKYSGGATLRSILDDLLENNAIKKVEDDKVQLIRTHYVIQSSKSEQLALDILAMATSDLIKTVNHNIQASDDLYFQRIVQQRSLAKRHVPLVQTFVRERSQKLADEVDSFIAALSMQPTEKEEEKIARLGLGIYYFQDEKNNK